MFQIDFLPFLQTSLSLNIGRGINYCTEYESKSSATRLFDLTTSLENQSDTEALATFLSPAQVNQADKYSNNFLVEL